MAHEVGWAIRLAIQSLSADRIGKTANQCNHKGVRMRYICTAPTQACSLMRSCVMASPEADAMVVEMAKALKARRLQMGVSMNRLAASSYLDRAALHRAEAGERIPSLAFWIDWADTLGLPFETVVSDARAAVGKKRGHPPERRPLI